VLLSGRSNAGVLALSAVIAWFVGYSETWAAKMDTAHPVSSHAQLAQRGHGYRDHPVGGGHFNTAATTIPSPDLYAHIRILIAKLPLFPPTQGR